MCGPHFCSMKIAEDVRKYAAEQNVPEWRRRRASSQIAAQKFTSELCGATPPSWS